MPVILMVYSCRLRAYKLKKILLKLCLCFCFFGRFVPTVTMHLWNAPSLMTLSGLPGDKYFLHISRQSSSVWSSIWSLFCSLISCGLGFKIYPTFPLWDLQNLSHRNQNLNSYVRNQLSTLFLIKKQWIITWSDPISVD